MNMPLGRSFRLVSRGGAGLACDKNGVALGTVELVRTLLDARGGRHCAVRSPSEISEVLGAAYGPQSDEIVLRLHRGLSRAAAWIEAGDLGRAGVETVMLGLADLTPVAMAKLAQMADLEKGGTAWQNQPRIPAGQTGGGEWTTDGGGAPAPVKRPVDNTAPVRDTAPGERIALPLDDGVYRPGVDDPFLIHTGGAEEDEEPRRGSNGPPNEVTSLQEVFPGLKDAPGLAIPLAPIDGFLGISASADAANLAATMMQYRFLIAAIRTLNPRFVDEELLPDGGIAGLSWQGRINLINSLRMERAATLYRFNGDVRLLQVESLRFLQNAVDDAYAEGVKEYGAERLTPRLSREEAIGNYMDVAVRRQLRGFLNRYNVPYGPGANVTINNRDYDTSPPQKTFRVPDARIGDISFDWTLSLKTMVNQQIRGFFAADSRPIGVVVVRPSQLGRNSTYLIPRSAEPRPRR